MEASGCAASTDTMRELLNLALYRVTELFAGEFVFVERLDIAEGLHVSDEKHPVEMKRGMASVTVASNSAKNPPCPSLFLTRNLLRGGGLLLLLGSGVGFDLLLRCLLMYGLRRFVAHIRLSFVDGLLLGCA